MRALAMTDGGTKFWDGLGSVRGTASATPILRKQGMGKRSSSKRPPGARLSISGRRIFSDPLAGTGLVEVNGTLPWKDGFL